MSADDFHSLVVNLIAGGFPSSAHAFDTPSTAAPTAAPSATKRPRRNNDRKRETAWSASSSSATSGIAEKNQNDDEDDEDRDRWNSATTATRKLNFPLRERRRRQRRVQREVEFPGERLRGSQRDERETGAVVLLHERRCRLSANI